MATVYVKVNSMSNKLGAPIIDSEPVAKQTITSSAESQRVDISAKGFDYKDTQSKPVFWNILPIGGSVWVKFGTARNLVAAAGDHYCKDGQSYDFAVGPGVQYVALINAA